MDIHHNSTEKNEKLWRAILSLESPEECQAFFADLCTVAELEEMAKRLDVALCIDSGMSYGDAAALTGASTATISRVKRSLYYGNGGYKTVIGRIKNEDNEND